MWVTLENVVVLPSLCVNRTRPLLDLARKTRNLCQRRILKCESHWRPVVLWPVFPISSSAARAKTRAPRSDNMFTSCQKVKILLGQALYPGLQCFSHPLHLLPGAFWGQRWMWIPDQTRTRNKKASVRNCSFFSALCVHTVIVIPEDIYASTSSQRKRLDGSFLWCGECWSVFICALCWK